MKINWCYKGIAQSAFFDDNAAENVLIRDGIMSVWMLNNLSMPLGVANAAGQALLSPKALDEHVNQYAKVRLGTPYISMSAGCYEYRGTAAVPVHYSGQSTAMRFATNNGKAAGYLFKCWVITGLKAAPEIPGIAEDVTNLSIYQNFFKYYRQGEVTAKLALPRRQIQSVIKLDKRLKVLPLHWNGSSSPIGRFDNPDFKVPSEICNLFEAL